MEILWFGSLSKLKKKKQQKTFTNETQMSKKFALLVEHGSAGVIPAVSVTQC